MSGKKIDSDASERKTQDTNNSNDKKQSNNAKIAIEKDNQDVEGNDSIETESVDMKVINYNEIQNENNDKLHTDSAKKSHKKDSIDSNVASYLKSDLVHHNIQEDIGLEEISVALPEYTEIDMMGQSRKYVTKDTKGLKFPRKKTIIPSMKQLLTVQFMGSESLPENKVLLEYLPDANKTIRNMFAVQSIMNFWTGVFVNILMLAPTREFLIVNGLYVFGFTFIIQAALVIITACVHPLRNKYPIIGISFVLVIVRSLSAASVSSYAKLVYGWYAYSAMFLTDICGVLLGCCAFDYLSGMLFFILIFACVLSLIVVIMIIQQVHALIQTDYNRNYYICSSFFCGTVNYTYIAMLLFFTMMQLRFLLKGLWVELGEDDYYFGGYLLYMSPFDYPLRVLRELGAFQTCDPGDGEEEEEKEK